MITLLNKGFGELHNRIALAEEVLNRKRALLTQALGSASVLDGTDAFAAHHETHYTISVDAEGGPGETHGSSIAARRI